MWDPSRRFGSLIAANWVSFDFNVAYSSCWGYSLINTLKLKKWKVTNLVSSAQKHTPAHTHTRSVSFPLACTHTHTRFCKHELCAALLSHDVYRTCEEFFGLFSLARLLVRIDPSLSLDVTHTILLFAKSDLSAKLLSCSMIFVHKQHYWQNVCRAFESHVLPLLLFPAHSLVLPTFLFLSPHTLVSCVCASCAMCCFVDLSGLHISHVCRHAHAHNALLFTKHWDLLQFNSTVTAAGGIARPTL